jgi:hypothetical protein
MEEDYGQSENSACSYDLNSVELKADRLSAGQQFLSLLWNTKLYYSVESDESNLHSHTLITLVNFIHLLCHLGIYFLHAPAISFPLRYHPNNI